jgi:IclR family transcriptional regulator, acetate operon repressor
MAARPHGDRPQSVARSGTQSIERAIAILECLRAADGPLALSDIARRLTLSPSTAHRLIRALVVAGYVEQDESTERYRLGLGVAVLGQRAIESSGYQLARPVLIELSERTGESVSLGIRRALDVVVIDHVAGSSPLRFDHTTGSALAIYASAMGKVLLASSTSAAEREVDRIGGFEAFTERTITDRSALLTELCAVSTNGYAINMEERYVGVSGIAAPVRSARGHAHAAVGVQGPSIRLSPQRLTELAPLVRDAADRIAALVIRV